ncbi:MAG: alpha-L-rhamnosidase [Anaerolineae bacterium]
MNVTALRCEYKINPLGIDAAKPRLSWALESDRRGARQTAYQVLVAASPADLDADQGTLWDSGEVASDQCAHVVYAGAALHARQRAWWKVRVWDEAGAATAYSAPAWWEMGLLDRAAWVGDWIGASVVGGPRTGVPCPFLRKPFATADRPIASARLYVTALGLYECYLNGARVGDEVFAPGWTDYNTRVQYQVYDVTDLLRAGANALGAILGDGWYCGHVAHAGRQRYGDRPRLRAQLMIDYADGSGQTIATDASWRTLTGPILESDLLMGESYDARLEFPGWSEPGFDAAGWLPVSVFDDPGVALVARVNPPVRRIEELRPVAPPSPQRDSWNHPVWVYDLGQNMVGWARLKVSGPAGTTVRLRFAEMLNPDGSIYTENLRGARATDLYTLRGDGEEVYEPRFTFHGFRYVEVAGYPGEPPADAVTGVVAHSDTPPAGAFACDDPLINQLQHNIVWGQKGNFLEVPTDCPQRDERMGWAGDAQVFIRTAAYNMDVAAFFTKWQQDLADAQTEAGQFPAVAPNPAVFGEDGGPAWADAGVICPWTVYLCYGDTRLLETHYDSMARFIDYLKASSPGFIRCHPDADGWEGFGDWLSIDADTPKDLIGTAYFAYCARLMARIAGVLGKVEDAEAYERLFQDVRRAFADRFVTPDGLIVGQTQTACVLALHFDLLPDHLRPAAVEALVRDITRRGMHLSTGFVGAAYLLPTLTEAGRLDVAYALLGQKTFPSWLYPVTQGATTIWERWDGWRHDKGFQNPGMNSFNHYAFGAVGAWLYRTVAGIDADPAQPAYRHIIMRPRPGGGITSARGHHDSLYGRIASEWRIAGGGFDWRVTVPPNTTATVYVPAGASDAIAEGGQPAAEAEGVTFLRWEDGAAVFAVTSGSYHFTVAGGAP